MRVRARRPRGAWRASRGCAFASVFLVNSGAEANENALKVALRMTGRAHVAAIEGGFHGRTAAAGAVTWGAQAKWYGFPRTPFDVSFIPRGDAAAITAQVTRDTAAVIVEPVQGLAGAVDLGAAFLAALRARCDEVGALLIFDEVQCGMGRTGEPFAANYYGGTPGHAHDRQGARQRLPVRGAADVAASPAPRSELEALGTTFGGGPMACAAIEAVIEAIETEGLLERVRRVGALYPPQLRGRPGHRLPGRRAAGGAAHLASGQGDPRRAARMRHPRRHRAPTRTCCGCCRPTSSRSSTSTCCATRCRGSCAA